MPRLRVTWPASCFRARQVRFLPLELHVSKGQSLRATFRHSEHDLEKVTLHKVPAEMGGVGFPSLLSSRVADQLGVVIELS